MKRKVRLPQLLVIDDQFGRTIPDQRNRERVNLCGQYLLQDVTGDEEEKGAGPRIKKPIAQVVFCRGQKPVCSRIGGVVENDLEGTLEFIRRGWDEWQPDRPRWAMVLLDLCFYTGEVTVESDKRMQGMPKGRPGDDNPRHYFGLKLLKALHDHFPDLPVVILSSMPRAEVSREFTSMGALGFLPRSDEGSLEQLRLLIWRHALVPDESGEIIGYSKPLLKALRTARRLAADRRNILIQGERGTGKELLAHYIHRQSEQQQKRPMVVVDSGALSLQLYASELFGHKKGAFTGADYPREGRIVQADGGDLFLDEIANMPSDVQVGLLRVLEQGQVMPVGASDSKRVDVRFIAATNENIEEKAETGDFRSDLIDRLRDGGTVELPPLRDRLEDVPELMRGLLTRALAKHPHAMVRDIDSRVRQIVESYDWPGNIRELASCLTSAVANNPDVEHLVPLHLHIPKSCECDAAGVLSEPSDHGNAPRSDDQVDCQDTLEALLDVIDSFDLESVDPAALAGQLPHVQVSCARLVVRLLERALHATARRTVQRPEGAPQIHPAMKLLTSDDTLTATQSADLIKRIMSASPNLDEVLPRDSIVLEAYEVALRLRPRGGIKSQRRQQESW